MGTTTCGAIPKNNNYKEISFFYSVWFTVAVAAFVYLFWILDLGIYGILVLGVLAGVILALCKDVTPIVPICFTFTQIIAGSPEIDGCFPFYLSALCAVIVGLIINVIRFRPYRDFGKVKGFFVATAAAGLAIIIGGITVASKRQALPALTVALYGALTIVFAFLFIAAMGKNRGRRLSKTVACAILVSSAIALLQLLTMLIKSGDFIHAINDKSLMATGYAQPGYLANIIARSIPVAIFLSTKNKKFANLWLLVAYCCGIGIVVTGSRTALIIALAIALLSLICFAPKVEDKARWFCTLTALIGITMVGLAFVSGKLENLFQAIFNFSKNSNGRLDLMKIGIDRFKEHPIFGVGLDYDIGGKTTSATSYAPYWYNNTFVQILCCFGIFGLLAYIAYFYWQYRVMLTAKVPMITALMLSLAIIQLIALLDAFFFTPQEYLQMLIITVAGIQCLPRGKGESHIYQLVDLSKKYISNKRSNRK